MTAAEFQQGKEGVFYDLPDPVYRQAPGISNSMLKKLSLQSNEPGSPAHFQVYLKDPARLTKPLLIGRLAHSAILRPEDPLETITIQPAERAAQPTDSAVKAKKMAAGTMIPWHNGSTYCQQWQERQRAAGNTVLTDKEYWKLVGLVKAVAGHPTAAAALNNGHAEVSLFKQYWRTLPGLEAPRMCPRKARLDWVSAGNSIVDIKTTTDARPEKFADQMHKLRYYVQAAYYLDLWNDLHPDNPKTAFVFIAVEKEPPYAICCYDVHPDVIKAGRQQYERDLNLFMTCNETDTWPAYNPDLQTLDLPQWYYRKDPFVTQEDTNADV